MGLTVQQKVFVNAVVALTLVATVTTPVALRASEASDPLPGTKPLILDQPLDVVMVDGINRFAERELAESIAKRAQFWHRVLSSHEAYEKSIAPNRERLREILGVVDEREKPDAFELITTTTASSKVARGGSYTVHEVRWRVLPGVTAEGLLLQPDRPPTARVIALPDADWTPEEFAGLREGVNPFSQVPRHLAESGIEVVVPTLINRSDTWSGNPAIHFTNQPHREFIYRMAFELGRHIIGYEVQKVLAAVDLYERMNTSEKRSIPIGIVGVGEGGLVAFYSAAIDPRIKSTWVSGYFGSREELWREPIYRNVWSLLVEFGDAEIASLVLPRALVIEVARATEIKGPPSPRSGRNGAAPGEIQAVPGRAARREFVRLLGLMPAARRNAALIESNLKDRPPGSDRALVNFIRGLAADARLGPSAGIAQTVRSLPDADDRQRRQFDELVNFTQHLLEDSAHVRDQLWAKAILKSADEWAKSAEHFRDSVWRTLIGKLPEPTMPPNVRTRKILGEPEFTGYEVMIDVYPDVIAGGILLLPKGMKPNEKRPVVVCQHGLEGVPMDTISKAGPGYPYYKAFTAELAKRGFITYAPQNPYRGGDRFRTIQRKSNPLGRSLFSYITPQHQRTVAWLATLPNVDPKRIAFYGLSYGGKTAVRVPTMLPEYCLSICSGDFNEWVRKNATSRDKYSYVFTPEYEMFEWNMGHVANYAELAYLMAPRPFMVERGHDDGVAPDEWVAWEYAKVRRFYDKLGIGDRTEIEFFNGPHTINGKGTFEFLSKHLQWPAPNR
jgi:cephalosporin-C deacetylase-like acetyl esterase